MIRIPRLILGLFLLPGLHGVLAAQQDSDSDHSLRARAILESRCVDCHGTKKAESGLKILDHQQLIRTRAVSLVSARSPADSLLLDLVEGGSMPPGIHAKVPKSEADQLRAWIAAGAPAFPEAVNERYAFDAVLADARKMKPEASKSMRYFTLHHLAAGPAAADGLANRRKEFLAAMDRLGFSGGGAPMPVDPPLNLVYRVDLKGSPNQCWYEQPFNVTAVSKDEPSRPERPRIFDLVLLEYPLATFPRDAGNRDILDAKRIDDLARAFLHPAQQYDGQIRPVPFVRGDWFIHAAVNGPLAEDLKTLFKAQDVVLPAHTNEGKLSPSKPLLDLPDRDQVLCLPAIDARYPGPPGTSLVTIKDLQIELIGKDGQPTEQFDPAGEYRIRIQAKGPIFWQVAWIGSKDNDPAEVQLAGEVREIKTGGKSDYVILPQDRVKRATGVQQLSVYVSDTRREFPQGETWQFKQVERVVHPFFQLTSDKKTISLASEHAWIMRKDLLIRSGNK